MRETKQRSRGLMQKQQNKIEIGQKSYIWKLGGSSEPPRPP